MNIEFLKTKITTFVRLFIVFFILFLFLITSTRKPTYAITPEQKRMFQGGILYFDVESSSDGCGTTASTESGNTGGGEFNNGRIVNFANSPINSSWGISDATVEQWFLKQAGARSVINRYGLNESNIGQITSAVKSAGVSVVFFYTHTVNEGGGAAGFINHYRRGNEAPGGGVGNAARDAQYLKETSNKTGFNPSWIDAGNPVDFVPPNIKEAGNAHFQNNIKTGTIGRVYIAAGAAAAWEVYYPDGLKKEFNKVQNYGQPFNNIIENIIKMGGNPLVSSSSECPSSTSVAGEGISRVVDWAKMIANNAGYGYGQDTRTTGWAKWQEDPNCADQCGDFDCSSFLAAAFTVGGFFETNPQFATSNMVNVLSKNGFTRLADSGSTVDNLQPGDILIKTGHTAMYIGNNQIVHASQNERNGARGGQAGDQTGKEITIRQYYDGGWNLGVWRAPQ